MTRARLAATFFALAAAIAGAAATDAQPASKKAAPPKKGLSDAAIEAAIKAKFANSKINADHFQVRVQGGTAILEGRTDVIQHKGVATRLAKTGGAAKVDNRIQISDAAREKAASTLAQGRRRAQIKRGEDRSETRSQQKTKR